MTTYRIRVGFHTPSALPFLQLDELLEPRRFCRLSSYGEKFRCYIEYEYQSEVHDYCSVCQLARDQACRVKRNPLVLVEIKNADPRAQT